MTKASITKKLVNILIGLAVTAAVVLSMGLQLAEASTSSSATAKINTIKTQTGFKPNACNWTSWSNPYPTGWTNCKSGCWYFVANVSVKMFGCYPSGTSGYTLTRPGNFSCVGTITDSPTANPSSSALQTLMLKAYPGDIIQFKGGPSGWGSYQHTAIVESVSSSGITIYQHDDSSHVNSTTYNWSSFYNSYLDFDAWTNYTKGISLYHYKNYSSLYPDSGQATVANNSPYGSNTLTKVATNTSFVIRSAGNRNLAVDVTGGNGVNGTNLEIYTRNGTGAQYFIFHSNDDGTMSISNWSGKCGLFIGQAADSYNNGTNVVMRDYVQTWAINRWYVEVTPDGYFSFRNKYSGLYLDIAGGVQTSGTNLQLYTGNGSMAQKFSLEACPYGTNTVVTDFNTDGGFVISPAGDSSFAISVSGGNVADGSNVQISAKDGTGAQSFAAYKYTDGTYSFANWSGKAGLFIGLSQDSTALSTNVVVRHFVQSWEINRWYLEKTSDGYYSFRNVYNGLYLDVTGGAMVPGTNLQTFVGNGTSAQKFTIERLNNADSDNLQVDADDSAVDDGAMGDEPGDGINNNVENPVNGSNAETSDEDVEDDVSGDKTAGDGSEGDIGNNSEGSCNDFKPGISGEDKNSNSGSGTSSGNASTTPSTGSVPGAPKVTSVMVGGVTYTISGKVAKVTKVKASKRSVTIAKAVTIGGKKYKVSKIAAKVFKGTKVTKVTVKSTTLAKAGVKNCLKGSKVKTVKVPKAKRAAYRKLFKKAVCGKKTAVK